MPNAQFYLHHHPQQEQLADLLLNKISEEGQGNPFYRSHVLVRNQGMGTWLKRRIATQSGLAMQVEFPQPNAFLQGVIQSQSTDPEDLKWQIYQALPQLLNHPDFQTINDYLSDSTDSTESALKRYQFSGITAGLFDKYLLYRPEWIAAWQQGEKPHHLNKSSDERWQRALWQHTHHQSGTHWTQILQRDAPLILPDDSVQALHVFGISNFAPIYVQFLYRLSEQIPVHIYWMNPVEAHGGYWEDAPSRHQWTMAKAFDDPETLNHHNPLLASFGRLGREFVHTIYGGHHTHYEVQQEDTSGPSPVIQSPSTHLEELQSSLYNNAPNKTEDKVNTNDCSVSIHACHTPLRELETLKNYLLTLTETTKLDASDVLVMCPDIASYAPAIEAVFGGENNQSLPFTIGDSHAPSAEPAIAAVLQLFSLHTTRFTNHEALALLSAPSILNHFGIEENDLSTLRDWIVSNGIRWGFTTEHVQSISSNCPEAPWTWQDGINRMLLGYAMPNANIDKPTFWSGLLPFHDIEGSNTQLLGSICDFVEWCHQIKKSLPQNRSLAEWVEQTHTWIDQGFNKDDDSQYRLQALYQTLDQLLKQSEHIHEPIPVEVFHEHLTQQLENTSSPKGFLSGAVTFCEMKPMRAIPSRVICLLGMNHDTFPRQTSETPFDLTQNNREKGDRSIRDDDTYSFLEALLSAREALFISYIGISIKDGKKRPPSTALQTLLDYAPRLKECLHEEKLHAFDPHYFMSSSPVSHDVSLLTAAQALVTPTADVPATSPLALSHDIEQNAITVESWVKAITHPARNFLQHGLQARTIYKDSPLETTEPLTLDPFSSYRIKKEIIETRNLSDNQIKVWQQTGCLPIGELGQSAIDDKFGNFLNQIDTVPETSWLETSIPIQNTTITGNIPIAEIDGQPTVVIVDPSDGKAPIQLRTWIYQLLASAQLKTAISSSLYGVKSNQLKQLYTFMPTAEYLDHLSKLHTFYLETFKQALPHFPKSGEAYLSKKPGKTESESEHEQSRRDAALIKWEPSSHATGESEDEAIHYLFDTSDLFATDFIATTQCLWSTVLEHRQ